MNNLVNTEFFVCINTAPKLYIAPCPMYLQITGFDSDELMNYYCTVPSWVHAVPLPIVYSNTLLPGGRISDLPNHIATLSVNHTDKDKPGLL
jgi:hypothetical protein